MRGQEPGSEHDRREADDSARPATPPPSFGRTNGRDVPPSSPPAEEADDGETRSVIPVFTGPPPDLPEPQPGDAQPWEVPGDDAAPYDWFADHADTDPGLASPSRPGRTPASPRSARRPPTSLTSATASPSEHTAPTDTTPPERPLTGVTPPEDALTDAAAPDRPSVGAPPPGHLPTGSTPPDHAPTRPMATTHPAATTAPAGGAPADPGQPTDPAASFPPAGPAPALPTPDTGPSRLGPGEADRPWADPAPADTTPWAGPRQADQPPPGAPWGGKTAETGDDRAQDQPVHNLPPWPAEPVVPGAPPWEPPPAFTAAAAGMPVWPGAAPGPHAMPPWPAATGELEAEPDAEDPTAPTLGSTAPFGLGAPAFDPNATEPEGVTRPAHYFDPEAARREAAEQRATQQGPATPGPQPQDTTQSDSTRPAGLRRPSGPQPITAQLAAAQAAAQAAIKPGNPPHAGAGSPAQAGARPTAEGPQANTPSKGGGPHENAAPGQGAAPHGDPAQDTSQETTRQRATGPLSAPVAPEHEDTRPLSHDAAKPASPETDQPPAPFFDPMAAQRDQRPGKGPAPLFDPNAPTPATARPPEPGDVPVWPPTPPAGAGQKLPDLPFSRESWGQRSSTALDLPTPSQGGGPAFPPGAFKQPPFQTPPPPPAPAGSSKRALLVTLGALALAGVATGGFFAYQAVSNPTATTAAARDTAAAPPSTSPTEAVEATPTDGTGGSVLNSEQTDPQKLSLSEAFPKKKVSAAGTTFTRVKASMETTCDKAATGAFAEALKEHKCSRVLRATYVDSKRRYAVTTGIAVLPTKDAATAADQAKNLGKNIWFRPLPGADGSGGERVHIAGGYAAGLVWGRYIVFSYATHADGHTPTAKEKTLPKVSGAFRDQTSLVLERRVTKG